MPKKQAKKLKVTKERQTKSKDATEIKSLAKGRNRKKSTELPKAIYKLSIGELAPAFEIAATSGKVLASKSFKGKILVLYFC